MSVTFTATVDATGKNTTGIVVPGSVLEELGAGKRPPVRVTLAGYEFRTTLGSMGAKTMIPVTAATRSDSGVAAGDTVEVTLVVDTTPRAVNIPDDFAAAMDDAGVRAFFDGLSNSIQRYHTDLVSSARQPETRERRIAKAIATFEAGNPR